MLGRHAVKVGVDFIQNKNLWTDSNGGCQCNKCLFTAGKFFAPGTSEIFPANIPECLFDPWLKFIVGKMTKPQCGCDFVLHGPEYEIVLRKFTDPSHLCCAGRRIINAYPALFGRFNTRKKGEES